MDIQEKMLLTDEEIYQAAKPHTTDKFWVVDFDRAISKAQLDKALNIRQDCEKCGGEGHFYYAEGGHKAECEVCQGTGTGLSLGEVWVLYQQGKLVELDENQKLPVHLRWEGDTPDSAVDRARTVMVWKNWRKVKRVKLVEKENK
ncbi:hypothetical protein LCGC14_1703980 [marine sediment metagenome]|uniref:Uncharacterized protein n=1 Tax=marine sediment metagenome TaxID=412755 RepID=A0A0F9HHP3_9ZZZZ